MLQKCLFCCVYDYIIISLLYLCGRINYKTEEDMKKVIDWLKSSSRWKHLLGGVLIGLGADDFYCAVYAGAVAAGALELKDKLHGGCWDWLDCVLTVAGATVVGGVRLIIGLL